MSDHDTTTTDPRDLLIAVVRRWLSEAAQWEEERAELVAKAERPDGTSRSALKRKADEAREALERERKISAGLRAERDAMQHCADAHEERAAKADDALRGLYRARRYAGRDLVGECAAELRRALERARDLGADVDGVLDPCRGGRSAGRTS